MNNILNDANEELTRLKEKKETLTKDLKSSPDSIMPIKIKYDKNGNYWFYEKVKDPKDNKWIEIYLPKKKKLKYITHQIYYSYKKHLLNIINNEIHTLEQFISNYHPEQKYDLYAKHVSCS